MNNPIVHCRGLSKSYHDGSTSINVLKNIDFDVFGSILVLVYLFYAIFLKNFIVYAIGENLFLLSNIIFVTILFYLVVIKKFVKKNKEKI